MHNWSGNYNNKNNRSPTERRSCGRPFAPELTVRAGGDKGRVAAVVPCCQTLGPPNEAKSILGHLDKETYEEIWEGERFKKLRKAHEEKNFDSIENVQKNSLDFYASVKSLYLQDRQQKILNSKKIINTQDDSDWEEIQN